MIENLSIKLGISIEISKRVQIPLKTVNDVGKIDKNFNQIKADEANFSSFGNDVKIVSMDLK